MFVFCKFFKNVFVICCVVCELFCGLKCYSCCTGNNRTSSKQGCDGDSNRDIKYRGHDFGDKKSYDEKKYREERDKRINNEITKLIEAKKEENVEGLAKEIVSTKAGLTNLYCTCYMNALIQTLMKDFYFLKGFLEKFFSIRYYNEKPICKAFFYLLCKYVKSNGGCVDADVLSFFKDAVSDKVEKFKSDYTMEDAAEFRTSFYDALDKEIGEDIFSNGECGKSCVKVESSLECLKCGKIHKIDDCSSSFVDVEIKGDSIKKSIEAYLSGEELKDNNAVLCVGKCKEKKTGHMKTLSFSSVSEVFVCQLKRFISNFDGVNNECVTNKVDKEISIDEEITVNDSSYILSSVLCHYSSALETGHYITFIKMDDDCWYLFDDVEVEEKRDCNKVNDLMYCGTSVKKMCYVLVYKKKNL